MAETHEAYAKAVKISPAARDALLDAAICTSKRWYDRVSAAVTVERERKKLYAQQAYDFMRDVEALGIPGDDDRVFVLLRQARKNIDDWQRI